jgi:hypothetical protein
VSVFRYYINYIDNAPESSMSLSLDKQMERVYRYVPTLGYKRAIEEVAGEMFDRRTDQFVPNLELRAALTERYNAEMDEFTEAGGY